MTQIPFSELFASWTPDLCVFGGLFAFALFAITAIALITAPVTRPDHAPRRQSRLARNVVMLGNLR